MARGTLQDSEMDIDHKSDFDALKADFENLKSSHSDLGKAYDDLESEVAYLKENL